MTAIAVFTGALAMGASAYAQTLPELLQDLIATHDRIKAAENDLDTAQSRLQETKGAYYPEFEITGDVGHQKRHNATTNDTSTNTNSIDATVTQLLWDFGKTNADVDISRLTRNQRAIDLTSARQTLLLDGITAYINVYRAHRSLEFAKRSEDNIKKQTELEDARVTQGAGFSTDVLQAKTQLAGAQARRVRAEGDLANSMSRFRSLFSRDVTDLKALVLPKVPEQLLPRSLEGAIRSAVTDNPNLQSTKMAADIAEAGIRQARNDKFFPTIEAILETEEDDNTDGTLGYRTQHSARIQLNFPFNLGLTAIDTLNASKSSHLSAVHRYGDARRSVEEQVRIAWQNLITARANHDFLQNQANIAQQFLTLAREEREAGRRSLLDVLSGETNLINAQSDAVSARADIAIAAYSLLSSTGRLELSVFDEN